MTTPPPPRVDVAAIRNQLDSLIGRFDCADLAVRVDSELIVRLQGYVESEGDRTELLAAARAIDGVRRVDPGITVQPWPLCELVRVTAGATSPDFRVVPDKLDAPYKIAKDHVTFRVFPPPGRQGFLNVIFLQSDRTAWHYKPWSQIRVRPGEKEMVFGVKEQISLDPPAGKMAIIAVLSSEPVSFVTFDKDGQGTQDTKKYLADLKAILTRQRDPVVSYVAFDTVQ